MTNCFKELFVPTAISLSMCPQCLSCSTSLETSGLSAGLLHAVASTFFVGRMMHGVCMGFMRSNMPLRIGGTALTLLPLLAAAVALLGQVLML